MPTVIYQGKAYECESDETLLDGVNRQGGTISYGCRGGFCQSCMVKAVKGTPPAAAQAGIRPAMKKKGYFLSCLCKPESDFEITPPDRRDEFIPATVTGLEYLNPTVIRLTTKRPDGFNYRPGQFVNLIRPEDGLARSYSLASIPSDGELAFHIRLLPDGKMSNWFIDHLQCGTEILLSDAMGDCCYRKGYADRPLLLAGTGTGLAPIYGILRDALASGHSQQIRLLHGALSSDGLYYDQLLRGVADKHNNFSYIPCLLNEAAPEGGLSGPIDSHIPAQLASDSNWVAFLCGDSEVVTSMRKSCVTHGMDESAIHSDAFG
ncbi:Ferredoxin-NADP reductase [Mariprofundus aestuarium]|uniref:Ferredoxin-NADP reductase n=1 Tax=Mariprofundus aestuarium TaxID=1921086 RepID=A0A2K8KUQ9_MARES|nr:2Fe-2S iron-sulfur cluster-binding protein [Mariprofundus aestuarium]ATX78485.1 Ferredoxin-NADP reductase [Mariprofundus aestuarium]